MVNGSFRGPKERRSFKPKVAGSTPVGRIPWCSALYCVLPGAEPSLRSSAGSACNGLRLRRLRPETGGGAAPAPQDCDDETLQVRRTAHEGQILEGTKTDHGEPDAGRVVPATLAWMLEAQIQLNGDDCELLFTTPRRRLWRERTSTATSGSRPKKPPAQTPAPTSAATATSRISGLSRH